MGLLRCGVLAGVAATCALPPAADARTHAAPPPISANPLIVAWTNPSLLSGSFVRASHDDPVEIQERRCGAPQFTPLLDVPSDPQGGWHVYVSPPVGTT
jgi:hypothetical protein